MPSKTKPAAEPKSDFKSTFRKYKDMNSGEQDAFKQGAKMVESKVKEKLGLKKKAA